MNYRAYDERSAAAIDYAVVTQFARFLRLQARMLDEDGDHRQAALLRRRATVSERAVL